MEWKPKLNSTVVSFGKSGGQHFQSETFPMPIPDKKGVCVFKGDWNKEKGDRLIKGKCFATNKLPVLGIDFMLVGSLECL